jgi:hypothetical protein
MPNGLINALRKPEGQYLAFQHSIISTRKCVVPTGFVKDEDCGYGFITPDGGGGDVFIHVKEVQKAAYSSLVAGT